MRTRLFVALCFLTIIFASCSVNNSKPIIESTVVQSLVDLNLQDSIIESEPVTTLHEFFNGKAIVYKIRYKGDDCEVVGYIGAPVDYTDKKYPVLVYNRGGNRDFGALEPEQIADYATHGYIVLASQYRGVDGGTGTDQFGGNDINDVIKLIDISEDFSFTQKGGVYMAGHSRGGMMTYIACRKDSRIKAAAVFAGISDTISNYNGRDSNMKSVYIDLIGGTPDKMREEYESRSAIMWANEINVPLLIVHGGTPDWRVNSQQSKDMEQALEKNNKEYKLVIYEEADHSLNGTNYLTDMDEWFANHPLE